MRDLNRENPWKRLSTREIYKNNWIRLREDEVIRPDGTRGIYGVVEMPFSVAIVALDKNRNIALVEQWRYAHGKTSLEVPVGSSSSADASPQAAAERELREEVGAEARKWTAIGTIELSIGVTTDVCHHFLAEDLTLGRARQDAEESIELRWVPIERAGELVAQGFITEASSVVAIMTIANDLVRVGERSQ